MDEKMKQLLQRLEEGRSAINARKLAKIATQELESYGSVDVEVVDVDIDTDTFQTSEYAEIELDVEVGDRHFVMFLVNLKIQISHDPNEGNKPFFGEVHIQLERGTTSRDGEMSPYELGSWGTNESGEMDSEKEVYKWTKETVGELIHDFVKDKSRYL